MLGTLIFPALGAIMSRHADEAEQGLVQGALHGTQSLAQAAGLLFFPALFSHSGALAFGLGGCLNLAALAVAMTIPRAQRRSQRCYTTLPLQSVGGAEGSDSEAEATSLLLPVRRSGTGSISESVNEGRRSDKRQAS